MAKLPKAAQKVKASIKGGVLSAPRPVGTLPGSKTANPKTTATGKIKPIKSRMLKGREKAKFSL